MRRLSSSGLRGSVSKVASRSSMPWSWIAAIAAASAPVAGLIAGAAEVLEARVSAAHLAAVDPCPARAGGDDGSRTRAPSSRGPARQLQYLCGNGLHLRVLHGPLLWTVGGNR